MRAVSADMAEATPDGIRAARLKAVERRRWRTSAMRGGGNGGGPKSKRGWNVGVNKALTIG